MTSLSNIPGSRETSSIPLTRDSLSERVSIKTLQEEFNRSIKHRYSLSKKLDENLLASILSLILPPVEPEKNLSL
ncbi:14224_t:CDS:2 [Funneliformis caledonium]|uniref:14224_t:CDS:1 n=1 Tax=Funneliformis caledonium TaxID=1117310 RepID=A0A9N9D8F4_9GLOM|nr:14224_t:CDS:2 [Funneliformis caledonium]